jgi:16S rRNA (uracil1498-N3)-methyltransferase
VRSTGGGVLLGEILPDSGADAPDLSPDSAERSETGEPARIILFQALPKGAKMDLIIRQATEAGVMEIVPFEGGHSVARSVADREGKNARRERIVREARQQSGSPRETLLHPPLTLEGALAYWKSLKTRWRRPLGLLMHPPEVPFGRGKTTPPEKNTSFSSGVQSSPLETPSFHGYLDTVPDVAAIAVGPEGGFSPEEVDRFRAEDFKLLSLGDTVLRTETAALYAIAAVRIILLERSRWILNPAEKNRT